MFPHLGLDQSLYPAPTAPGTDLGRDSQGWRCRICGVSINGGTMGVPPNGWFSMEILLKWMSWGYPHLRTQGSQNLMVDPHFRMLDATWLGRSSLTNPQKIHKSGQYKTKTILIRQVFFFWNCVCMEWWLGIVIHGARGIGVNHLKQGGHINEL